MPDARRRFRSRAIAALAALGLAGLVALVAPPPAAALFEDLPLSPRARAMGEATLTTMDDAWAFYYNPAMLTMLDIPQADATTVRPNGLDFNRLTGVAVATPLRNKRGGIAIGWRRYAVDYKDNNLVSENTLSISHGFRLFGDASTSAAVGWTLNAYNATFAGTIGASGSGADGIDPGNAWAVGLDLGAVVRVYERTRVGFFTRNLNSPTIGDDSEELRQQVGGGISYQPYAGVTTAIDVRNTIGDEFRLLGGFEFEVVPALELRAGIETHPNKVAAGFGIHLPYVTLDYGFSSGGGVLDTSHHFGLGLRWQKRETTEAGR